MRSSILALGTLGVAYAVSCSSLGINTSSGGQTGGGGSGGASGSGGGGGSGGKSGAIPCDGQPAKLSLGGVWAAQGQLSIKFQSKAGGSITTCPKDQGGVSTLLLFLTIKEDPSDATKLSEVRATMCSINLPVVTALVGDCPLHPTNLVSTQLVAPQKLIDALPTLPAMTVGGSVDGQLPGANVVLDRFTITVGSTKSGANMPQWNTTSAPCASATVGHQMVCESTCVDDCNAVVDADKDGFPGVSIEVCGYTTSDMQSGLKCNADSPNTPGITLQGRGFMDIQVDPQFSGTATSSCELLGLVDTDVLYNLIGADVYLANSPIAVTSAIKSLPEFAVQKGDSKFQMIRVDGKFGAPNWKVDPADPKGACASILAHANDF